MLSRGLMGAVCGGAALYAWTAVGFEVDFDAVLVAAMGAVVVAVIWALGGAAPQEERSGVHTRAATTATAKFLPAGSGRGPVHGRVLPFHQPEVAMRTDSAHAVPYTALPPRSQEQVRLHANLFYRFVRVGKANLNNLLNKVEDPEIVLDQAVNDMQKDLVKVRQSYAEVSATVNRMRKQVANAEQESDEWYRKAQLALERGEEELAREALTMRQAKVDLCDGMIPQIQQQEVAIENLRGSMEELEMRITEAKSQKEQLVARARMAKTSTKVNDMLSGVSDGSSSMAAFDRMKEKVESLEAEAEVTSEMARLPGSSSAGRSLEDKFALLEGGSKVDDALEELKAATNRALPSGQDE